MSRMLSFTDGIVAEVILHVAMPDFFTVLKPQTFHRFQAVERWNV